MKFLLNEQETERLLFRKIERNDFNIWLEFHKNSITSKHWISEKKIPEIECENWYEKQFYRYKNDKGGMNALIEKKSGKLIGYCGLLLQKVDTFVELEIGYSLLPEYWNKGYATEAAKKCRDFAFQNKLTESLISIISLTNKASETVALKNGMRIEKKTDYNGNEVTIFRINKIDWKNESFTQ